MKPLTQNRNTFLSINNFHLQPLLKLCEKLFGQLCSSLALRLRWGLRLKENIQGFRTHLVHQGSRISLAVKELWICERYRVGVLLVIVAVLVKHLYKVFDSNAIVPSWYFKNEYWFFWTIRMHLFSIFFSLGVMLFFPKKMKLKYIVLFGMVGPTVEILHYRFYTVDYITFHLPSTLIIQTLGFVIPIFLTLTVDYMAYRKYHIKHGSVARIFGIAKTPNLPAETKLEIINREEEVINNFYAKY
jgi:hypothetical protein